MNHLLIKKVFTNMTKKNLFLVAMASVVFAACSDDFADAPPVITPDPETRETPIVFNSSSSALTRADITGAKAADLLGKQFVVSGYKGSKTETADPNIVYENFLVKWAENTANTTESNTDNWEYVGIDPIKHAVDKGIAQQTIKYWDYSQAQYDFIAWSAGKKTAIYEGTPAAGEVLVTAIDPGNATTAAYTFTGSAADLSQCYIADLVTVKKDGTTKTKYAEPVVLTFRSLGTKVRIGIYETVPGYSVKNVKFYPKAGQLTAAEKAEIDEQAKIFTATADVYATGTYTVKFPTVDDPDNTDNNQAHITFAGDEADQKTIVNYGLLDYTIAENAEKTTGDVFLGRTSNTATFAGDPDVNYYSYYLPNETGTNFNLRVDFTLESIDGTGETIDVKNASAQVPLIYTQWKPGFAYTYLFKISDKTNGRTGPYDPTKPDTDPYNSDPAGLYPITFDAVVVDAEDNGHTQETITTITTPSITTYQQASTVVDNNEYTANGNKIYVTVNENDALVVLKDETSTPAVVKAALYTIEAGRTEADVVDAMQIVDDYPQNIKKGRNGLVLTETDFDFTNQIVSGVDGNIINIGDNQALSFEPASGTTYAFVYTQTAPDETANQEKFQPVTVADGESVKGLWRWGLKNASAGDVKEGVIYFLNKTSGMQDVFLGQTVDNLYLDDQGTVASGHAKTGTTYYYTIDGGQSYKAAHVVPYADFGTSLYVWDSATSSYVPTTDAKPQSGTAYYFLEDDGITYTYCVIYPQQTNGTPRLMIENTTKERVACTEDEVAYSGMTYYDKYTVNNGVYYAKIIKVQ